MEGFLIFRGGGGGGCCWKRAANSVANAVKLCWEGPWEAAGLLYRSFAYLQRTFVYTRTHSHTRKIAARSCTFDAATYDFKKKKKNLNKKFRLFMGGGGVIMSYYF